MNVKDTFIIILISFGMAEEDTKHSNQEKAKLILGSKIIKINNKWSVRTRSKWKD